MSLLFVKPVNGKVIYKEDPPSQVNNEGDLVPNNSFYRRRIKRNDLYLVNSLPKHEEG